MKKVLYVGILSDGSTSKMRAEILRNILDPCEMDSIDTDIPKLRQNRLWQSIGFRYKIGPLINAVNEYILFHLRGHEYDMIWVDKAIYITDKTTHSLKKRTPLLIHYTPDPAFTFHRSRLFYRSLPMYDYVVTTKSYEIKHYQDTLGSSGRVIYATQGYNPKLHRPITTWENKRGIAFIGHYEKERGNTISKLLNNGLEVTLAGRNWEGFAKKHMTPSLRYLGSGVYGDNYVSAISSALFAWGSISKWIPEKHTTRTFEIPACRTALITEKNDEISSYFNDDEVIYYDDAADMIRKLMYYEHNKEALHQLIDKGYNKVRSGGFDYESILRNILKQTGIIQ